MADDAQAVDTDERRAAVLGVVEPLCGSGDRPAGTAEATRVPKVAESSSWSSASTVSTSPSLTFSVTLPVKPSQTITSAWPAKTSGPSTLPTKLTGADLSSWCASRVSSLPLLSSAPTESRADARLGQPSATARRRPHDCELHEVMRPAFDSRARIEQHRRRPRVGMIVASAGRSTPGSRPNAACAAITAAPVWPALNSASAGRSAHGLRGDADRGARLPAQRRRRRLLDLDAARVCRAISMSSQASAGMARQLALDGTRAPTSSRPT